MKKIGATYIVPEIKEFATDLETIFADSDPDSDQGDPIMMDYQGEGEERLELPRPLPHDLDLSQAVVFVGETERSAKVFVVDSRDGTLYHVVNFARDKDQSVVMDRNGYSALGGKVYFIGGIYGDHDVEWSNYEALCRVEKDLDNLGLKFHYSNESHVLKVEEEAKKIRAGHLEVQAFDLTTRDYVAQPSKLCSPKPYPIVFVYGGKIYVFTAPVRHLDIPEMGFFECLDPSSDNETTWTKLPDPTSAYPSMLDRKKGTLLALKDGEEAKYDEFDLTKHEWRPSTDTSYRLVLPPEGMAVFKLENCIVDDFLFCYEDLDNLVMPSVVVYQLDGKAAKSGPYTKISLSKALEGYRIHQGTYGFINHLNDSWFSLVIFYFLPSLPKSFAVCTITLELLRSDVVARREGTIQPKKLRIEKPVVFTLGRSSCRTFQLPNDLEVSFCKKMM